MTITIIYRNGMGEDEQRTEVDAGAGETVADAVFRAVEENVGDDGWLIAVHRDGERVL